MRIGYKVTIDNNNLASNSATTSDKSTDTLQRGVVCISIALDRSCSGIQHFQLRSTNTGRTVNLLTPEPSADMYGEVADFVRQAVGRGRD